jgi:hypothetical protein
MLRKKTYWLFAPLVAAGAALAFSTVGHGQNEPSSPAAIDLAGYRLTFDEGFDTLSVSAWGPGTRWIAHTPWYGDFGAAIFSDPKPGFPFTTKDGILTIEMRKDADGKWRSGLLASVDPQGNGFSQKYGYFEVRARMPGGNAVWPAFWLVGVNRGEASPEIDVIEYYGRRPDIYMSSNHVWRKSAPPTSITKSTSLPAPGAAEQDFHTYGVLITEQTTAFYFDRKLSWETPTSPEARQPMMLLVNLALEGDWTKNPPTSPKYMQVDYVRAYLPKAVN